MTAVVSGGTRVIGLAIAESLVKRNASVAIAPAFIEDTGIFTQWSEEKKAMLKEKIFVTRLGNSPDVVRAFEYLLDSSFVTGVTLDVSGGAFMI